MVHLAGSKLYHVQEAFFRERLERLRDQVERARRNVGEARRIRDLAQEIVELSRTLRDTRSPSAHQLPRLRADHKSNQER